MAIFKLINETFMTSSLKIEAKNMEVSWDHFKDFKNICKYGKQLEEAFYKTNKENFYQEELVSWAINISKNNPRIVDTTFFNTKDTNNIILLLTTDVPSFHNIELFDRKIDINMNTDSKIYNFVISIIEINNDEIKNKDLIFPPEWIKDEKLTTKLNNMKYFI
jgi:hypothetical protein